MESRYTKLYSLPENLYRIGAPVLISAGALLKDNQTGNVIAQIRLKNIGNDVIKAIKIHLALYDTAGRELEVGKEYQYLDLHLERDQMYGEQVPIVLDDSSTRSYKVTVKEIIFLNNAIWHGTSEVWEDKLIFTPIVNKLKSKELVKQYAIEIDLTSVSFVPEKNGDLWICACGAVNRSEERSCHMCHKHLSVLQSTLDVNTLTSASEKRIAEEYAQAEAERTRIENEKKERQRIREEKKNSLMRATKESKCKILVGLVIICLMMGAFHIYNKNSVYNEALQCQEAKAYVEAFEKFSTIPNYRDSKEHIEQLLDELLFNADDVSIEKAINFLEVYPEADKELLSLCKTVQRIENNVYRYSPEYRSYYLEIDYYVEKGKVVADVEYDNYLGTYLDGATVNLKSDSEEYLIEIVARGIFNGKLKEFCFYIGENTAYSDLSKYGDYLEYAWEK